jgi:hypothetical protein
VQIDNGRVYLREMVFGDPSDAHHAEALRIVAATEEATASILRREPAFAEDDAASLARIVSAIMFLTMSASINAGLTIDELALDVRRQIGALLGR